MRKTNVVSGVLCGVEVDVYTILINDTDDGFKVKVGKNKDNTYVFQFLVGIEGSRGYRIFETFTVCSPSNKEIKDTVSNYIEISKQIIV